MSSTRFPHLAGRGEECREQWKGRGEDLGGPVGLGDKPRDGVH